MKKVPATRRLLRRHPVVLWSAAFLCVVLIAWAIVSGNREPPTAPAHSTQSPAVNGADLQWPDLTGTLEAPVETKEIVPETEAPGRTFITKLNLRPRFQNGRVKGYVVGPDEPSILQGTPLQPGDVLLEVDGLMLDPARVEFLAKNVGDYQDVFVRFERGSSEREGMLPLGRR